MTNKPEAVEPVAYRHRDGMLSCRLPGGGVPGIDWTPLYTNAPDSAARIAELEAEVNRLKAENRDACLGLNDFYAEKLRVAREAWQAFMDSHEECIDFDGFTAQVVSMDDYHTAQEALAIIGEEK